MTKILLLHIFLLTLVFSCVSTETPDTDEPQPEESKKTEEVKKEESC